MVNADIRSGDVAIIKKDIGLVTGQIVMVRIGGKYTLKRLYKSDNGTTRLLYEDGTGRELDISKGEWETIGVFCFVG